MIILAKFLDVSGVAVIKTIVLLVMCFCLISCERLYGITNNQLRVWVDDNAQYLSSLAQLSTLNEVSGDVNGLEDMDNIKGYFKSINDEESLKKLVKEFFNEASFPDKGIGFNLERNNKHRSIYISLYIEGACAAFGDCLETFVVYHENEDFIDDPSYHYHNTKVADWYILKIGI